MIKYNSNTVSKWYDGASNAKKMYYGNKLMFLEYLIPPSYKLVAHYSDTTVYKVECDGGTTLSTTDTRGHTTPISAMTSAVVNDGGCVTQIGMNAFSGATSLTSLTLSDGITTFNNQAFIEMHSLESFTFPSSLTTFGGSVFRFSNIKKFNNKIPSGVTHLGSGALADMYKLTGMTIPATITGSSTNLFLRDSGLTEVHFERRTAPELGADAFKNCTALIKIYIPDCDCYDSYAAQSQFSGLTNIIYAEDNTSCYVPPMNFKMKRYFIDGRSNEIACNSSSAVTSADTRNGYTEAQLTATTSGLSKVEIGDCVSTISGNTFRNMLRLSSITLSNSVKTVADYGCRISDTSSENRIHDIDLGKVETIGNYAFRYCGNAYGTNQPKIKFPKTLTSIGNSAFIAGKFNELTFENGGSCSLGVSAFTNCNSYSGVSISTNSITSIGDYCFCKFSGLTSVSLIGVTSIGSNGRQFSSCKDLKDLEIRGTNLIVPAYFVGGASLTAITLGGISEISNAYGLDIGNTSASVRSLTMLDTTPPKIGSTSISNYNPTVIYVPASAVNAYKATGDWYYYRTKIQAIPT
jgi:hypothetical protein